MTSKYKHTPGPWTLQLHTCDTISQMDGRDDWTIRGADGSAVCTEGGWHSAEVAQANVALILAAPDLLAQRDCRLCAHYTAASGGCRSVIRCVDSAQYKATAPRQYWETRPEPERALAADVARCSGVEDDAGGWREGCADCRRRTDRSFFPQRAWMAPPALIVSECEARIAP